MKVKKLDARCPSLSVRQAGAHNDALAAAGGLVAVLLNVPDKVRFRCSLLVTLSTREEFASGWASLVGPEGKARGQVGRSATFRTSAMVLDVRGIVLEWSCMSHFAAKLHDLQTEASVAGYLCRFLDHNDYIKPHWDNLAVATPNLSHSSLYPITKHRFAYFTANSYSNAAQALSGKNEDQQILQMDLPALLLDKKILSPFA
jgi:hypothetical protein